MSDSGRKYLEPWDSRYADRFDDSRIKVIARALTAPSSHNMQAWKVRLDDVDKAALSLFVNADRLTPSVDPPARQATISQGTFLEYIKVAAESLGFTADVALFPDGEYDEKGSPLSINAKPVAGVMLKKTVTAADVSRDALFLASTSRVAYQPVKLTAGQIQQLQNLNADADITLSIFQDDTDVDNLKKLAWDAACIEAGVERIGRETQTLFRPSERAKNKDSFGFSLEGQGFTKNNIMILQTLLTIFPGMNSMKSSTDSFLKVTKTALDHTPAFIMIVTKNNSRTAQVRAGMLCSRLRLACQPLELCVQPVSQALEEYPEMKQVYERIHRDYAPDGNTIQILARIGKPVRQVLHSMRLGVSAIITR